MSHPLRRLGLRLICQIACRGKTLVRRDARSGILTAMVVCTRCGRLLETEEKRFSADPVCDRRVA
jgi:hypothetical protein